MRLGFWVNSFPCDTNSLNDHFQRCWGCCYNPLLGFPLQPTLLKLQSCCSQFLPIHPTTPDPVRPLPNLRLVGERSTQGSLIFNIRPAVSYRPKFYNLRQYFVHTCAILCAPPEYHHWEGCGSLLSPLSEESGGLAPFFKFFNAILTFFAE